MSIDLISTGSHTEGRILDNETLSGMVDTSDEWITERTGIKTRYISDNISTEDLAFKAASDAIKKANIEVDKIDLVIFSTFTSDTSVPSSAHTLAGKLGIKSAVCFDVNTACCGYIYALSIAKSMMESGDYRTALVTGSERLSKHIDWNDRSTCILFGDGAGCCILKKREEFSGKRIGIKDFYLSGQYDENGYLCVKSKGESSNSSVPVIKMNGRQVYRFATEAAPMVIEQLLKRNGISKESVTSVIPHQANRRIIETMAEKSGISFDRFFINVDRYGNTSSASIAIALDEYLNKADRINGGNMILCIAFGGGLSCGGILLEVEEI